MNQTCIILAGGLGTRLRGTVPDLPKCLAPIAGEPFLKWQLLSLAERGINSFVLALGHGADVVLGVLNQPWANSLSIVTIIEGKLLGTGGAARFAMHQTGLDEVLIANGDTFLGGSLQEMLSTIDLDSGELMRIATVQVADRSQFGGVVVNREQQVISFLEKGTNYAGTINAGLYRINLRAFYGQDPGSFSMETQVMPLLVTKNALQARMLAGPFIDIGIPDDYHLFNNRVHDYLHQA